MARANSIITTTIDPAARTVTFAVKGAGSTMIEYDKLDRDNQIYAALHGLKQRGGDNAAISRDPDTGKPATPMQKLDAIRIIADHYNSGAAGWSVRGPGGGGGGVESGLTIRAIARVQGTTVEDVRERLVRLAEKRETTPKALLAQLAQRTDVIAAMNAIRLESAKPADEVDNTLDEMMNDVPDADDDDTADEADDDDSTDE